MRVCEFESPRSLLAIFGLQSLRGFWSPLVPLFVFAVYGCLIDLHFYFLCFRTFSDTILGAEVDAFMRRLFARPASKMLGSILGCLASALVRDFLGSDGLARG